MATRRRTSHHRSGSHHRRRRAVTVHRRTRSRRVGGVRSTAKRVLSKTFNNDVATVAGAVGASVAANILEEKLIPANMKKYTNVIEMAVGLLAMRYVNNKFVKGVGIGLAVRGATNLLHSRFPAITGFEAPHLVSPYAAFVGTTANEQRLQQSGGYGNTAPDPNYSNVWMRENAYFRGGNIGADPGYQNIFKDVF